jgi:hypothetical protein
MRAAMDERFKGRVFRPSPDRDFDWVDADGRLYEAMGGGPAASASFAKDGGKTWLTSFDEHLTQKAKEVVLVVDLSDFTFEQQNLILAYSSTSKVPEWMTVEFIGAS